ncbi:MAG TPA: hypothetical protein IAC24_04850 [Candidatus Onthousia faecigallinarum]|nr:hypothetical protein [Candidatus Onthousia faecigallinarum]
MKRIVVIGCGNVGLSYIEKLVLEPNLCAEIVLIDLKKESLEGKILDLEQGLVLKTNSVFLRVGDYEDCNEADIIVLSAGVKQSSKDRLADLEGASRIVEEICKKIEETSFQGIFLVATNPLDVICQLVSTYLDYPREKIIGTGTTLDTARLRSLLSKKLGVRPLDIQVYVLGEHGNSQFVAWSNANIGLQNLSNFIREEEKESLSYQTGKMGVHIVSLQGYTADGVASCLVRLTMAILLDEKAIYPVSHYQNDYDVYFSTPAVIGKNGIEKAIQIKLSIEEKKKMDYSARKIKEAVEQILPPELY